MRAYDFAKLWLSHYYRFNLVEFFINIFFRVSDLKLYLILDQSFESDFCTSNISDHKGLTSTIPKLM